MPLTCPFCDTPAALHIIHRLELPPDERSDEVTLQLVRCDACGVEAGAIYEESRRGASESFNHFAFRLDELGLARLKRLAPACPDPGNRRCTCPAHAEYAGPGAYRQVVRRRPLRVS